MKCVNRRLYHRARATPRDGDESLYRKKYLPELVLTPLGVSGTEQPKSSDWIITPLDSRYRLWETHMVLLAVYSMLYYPFEIAFFSSSIPIKLYVADIVVDLFFAVDIILTFFVAYIDPRTQLLVSDRRKIALRYLSTWFLMDVASTFPFGAVGYAFTGKAKVTSTTYTILGLFRFWRLQRISQLFNRLEKDIRFNYFWIRCVRLLIVTLLAAHCAGCLYYLLADRYPNKDMTWLGKLNPNFKESSLWIRYISALYWSITTLTTVGYGDFHAMNTTEMTVNMFYMLFNLALTSYLIGNITNLVLEGSHRTMEFRSSIQAASKFASRNRLPPRLKSQMFAYMYLRYKAERLNQHQLINQLPKSIYKSISTHLFLPTVKKAYIFRGVSPQTLSLLVAYTEAEYFPPREDVIMQDEAPNNVYIIVSGEVEIIEAVIDQKEAVLGILQSGDVFGEIGALCGWPQNYSFRTKILSQLLRLKTSDLIEIMQAKPGDNEKMLENLLQRNKRPKDSKFTRDLAVDVKRKDVQTMCIDVLSIPPTGKANFPDEFLTPQIDAETVDPKGKAPLHIEAAKGHCNGKLGHVPRVTVYKGHPQMRKKSYSLEPGRVVRLPNSLEELKRIAGEKFGIDATNSAVMDEAGAHIDSMEVIRDDDELFIVEETWNY